MSGFSDLAAVARDAEKAPADGRILEVGAGGGLELRAFAEAQPGWRFGGVPPMANIGLRDGRRWALLMQSVAMVWRAAPGRIEHRRLRSRPGDWTATRWRGIEAGAP